MAKVGFGAIGDFGHLRWILDTSPVQGGDDFWASFYLFSLCEFLVLLQRYPEESTGPLA